MVFSLILYQLIDAQVINTISILNNTETTTQGNETNQVYLSTTKTTATFNKTVNSSEIIATSTPLISATMIDEITTSVIESNPHSKCEYY